MNPLSPKQILRNLENGFFMTHQEQAEAAEYIRQLQQSNEAMLEELVRYADELFNLRKELAKSEPVGKIPTLAEMKKLLNGEPIELAKPEQEGFYIYKPVLPKGVVANVNQENLPWVYDQEPSSGYSARMLVYTAPPRKEWVGLTYEEIKELLDCGRGGLVDIKKAEQMLKEKNYD